MNTHKIILALLLFALGLSACAPASVEISPTFLPSSIPTIESTAVPTPWLAIDILPPLIEPTERQKEVYANMPQPNEPSLRVLLWFEYWSHCDNPPFDRDAPLYWDAIFDDVENPTELFRVVKYGEGFYSVPVSSGDWMDPPATTCQGTMDPAYAPILLATESNYQMLTVSSGVLRRRDDQGILSEKLNMYSGQWEEVSYSFDGMQNQPPSYEYFLAHLDEFHKAPGPIDDPQRWADFLALYTSRFGELSQREINISLASADNVSELYDGNLGIFSVDKPISGEYEFFYFEYNGVAYPCYSLTWGVENVPMGTLIFVLQDKQNPDRPLPNIAIHTMEQLSRRELTFSWAAMFMNRDPDFMLTSYGVTPDMMQLLEAGINGAIKGNQVRIGFVSIY